MAEPSGPPAPPLEAAMVLAAGLGTRLRPLTDERPKPLVWIGDRPQLLRIVDQVTPVGRVLVNAHWHAAQVLQALVDAGRSDVGTLVEPNILGTAGALANARATLGPGDVLLWNGDVLCDLRPEQVTRRADAVATLVVVDSPPGRSGPVGLDEEGRVVRLRAERSGDPAREVRSAQYAGIARLGRELIDTLPDVGCLVGDALIPALLNGARIATFYHQGDWRDVGQPATYLEANLAWLKATVRANAIVAGSFVSPAAEVSANVELRDAVVLGDARVEGSGTLESCVVWPGSTAHAPAKRTIFTVSHTVRV